MSFWTLTGNGAITSNEDYAILRPKYNTAAKRGILYCHGTESNNGGLTWPSNVQRYNFLAALAGAGHVIVTADLGGNTFGNDTAIARITTAYNYLLTLGVLPSTIALIGHSMGGQNSLVWAAQNLSNVQSFIGIVPVINVQDIWTNNRGGLTSTINTAYGGAYDPTTQNAVHNPYTLMNASAFIGLKAQLYYGNSDSICLPTFTQQMASNYPTTMTAIGMNNGHDENAFGNLNVSDILTLINSS